MAGPRQVAAPPRENHQVEGSFWFGLTTDCQTTNWQLTVEIQQSLRGELSTLTLQSLSTTQTGYSGQSFACINWSSPRQRNVFSVFYEDYIFLPLWELFLCRECYWYCTLTSPSSSSHTDQVWPSLRPSNWDMQSKAEIQDHSWYTVRECHGVHFTLYF